MAEEAQYVDEYLRPHWGSAAVVTIDLQGNFLSDQLYGVAGTTEILPNVCRLASTFRAAGRPIVHMVLLYEPGGGNASTDQISQSVGS